VAQPRRLRARAAVVDRCKSQQSPGLSRLPAAPRLAAKGGSIKISTKGYRTRQGEPPNEYWLESHRSTSRKYYRESLPKDL
jgi:hypothetical protein